MLKVFDFLMNHIFPASGKIFKVSSTMYLIEWGSADPTGLSSLAFLYIRTGATSEDTVIYTGTSGGTYAAADL